jgi:dihydrofolate reductase
VISAALAALAIVGRVPGIWSSAALAVEAEVLYLAGIQLASPFVRGLGYCAFACSLTNIFFAATSLSKTVILGHNTLDWTPAALFHAGLFYVNRALRKPNVLFSSAAAVIIAAVLAADPVVWTGAAWVIFGAILYELKDEFRLQSYFLLALGAGATFLSNVAKPHAPITELAITLAVAYQATFRRDRTLQIGATTATALFSALMVYRLVPTTEQSLAWMALSILFLLHERVLAMHEFRAAGSALAALAFLATLIQHPSLTVSLTVVAGLYAAQLLMHLSEFELEEILFSIAGTLLLSIVLYGRVSGGLLTVAWGCQGLALLAAGFPLGQRVLRLQGLALFFTCILKLFLYDLRNLETLYRILSFVALGVILLGVSWVYTRFQDQIKKLL